MSEQRDDSVRLQYAPIELRQSSLRQTPNQDFGLLVRRGLGRTGAVVGNLASGAGYSIPGSAIVGAAVQEFGQAADVDGAGASHWTGGHEGLGTLASSTTGDNKENFLGDVHKRAQQGDSAAQMMMATQQMQEMNAQFNLGYLRLQQASQDESRRFSALSNVMKAKHDTARNSLSNLK